MSPLSSFFADSSNGCTRIFTEEQDTVNLQDLRVLLDYHYWARDRILDAVEPLAPEQLTRDMGNSFRSIRDTLVHTYAAEWAWYSRWQGESPTALLASDTFSDLASIRREWSAHETNMRALLERLGEEGVNRRIDYKLLNGQPSSSVFWHMCQHVVNHATYHRGQVTTMLRQLGATPPKPMDLIAFYRETGG
jgi:uncharacterized damage-inducible protein DinB